MTEDNGMSIHDENTQMSKFDAPMTPSEVRGHIEAIQAVMKAVMREGTHYGKIPGTNKPMLYKAGAEVLMTTFHISSQPEIVDLSGMDEVRYRVTVRGVHMGTGVIVGMGMGECSTNEDKYKWRGCGEKEYENTLPDRKRIKYVNRYDKQAGRKIEAEVKQVRTEPADLANTVLKMALKRGKSDLCLSALAASDVFDQDTDDLPERTETKKRTTKESTPPQKKEPAEGDQTGLANEKQLHLVKVTCDQAGIREVDFLAQFGLRDWEQLPFAKVNEALEWIKATGA